MTHQNYKTAFILAAVIAAFLFAQHIDNGPSDMAAEDATAASLRDALQQAQQERPELWTHERIERAGVATVMAAQGVTK